MAEYQLPYTGYEIAKRLKFLDGVTSDVQEQIDDFIKIFIGTQEQYDTANSEGRIPVGALVIIVDNEADVESTLAILGSAVLGQVILG